MSKLIDLTGQRFGRLTVLYKDTKRKGTGSSYWICQCDCGKVKSVKSSSLRRGEIQSCGCFRDDRIRETKKIESEKLIGQRFGKLTVLKRSERKGSSGELYWICQCDCGNVCEVRGHSLKRTDGNQTVSCGCFHRSIGAQRILNILEQNNIPYIDEYVFKELPKSRFDFAILNENQEILRLIEFDGEQHYRDIPSWGGLGLQQCRDKIKNEFAKAHQIPLVRIPYWEQENISVDLLFNDKYLI